MLHPIQANALEIRRRLRLPPGGRRSSELEIVSESQIRREAWEGLRQSRLDAERERQEARADALARKIEASKAAMRAAKLLWLEQQQEIEPEPVHVIPIRRVIEYCSVKYNVGMNEIYSTRRTMRIATVRQIIAYLCCELTSRSMPEIGRCLDRDHSTIIHSRDKMRARVRNYPAFASEIAAIKAALGAE